MLVSQLLLFVIIVVKHIQKGAVFMFLDIIGYVFGIGFVVFGISALVLWLYEIYKIISKSKRKVSYKNTIYFAAAAVVCGLILIILANVI